MFKKIGAALLTAALVITVSACGKKLSPRVNPTGNDIKQPKTATPSLLQGTWVGVLAGAKQTLDFNSDVLTITNEGQQPYFQYVNVSSGDQNVLTIDYFDNYGEIVFTETATSNGMTLTFTSDGAVYQKQ